MVERLRIDLRKPAELCHYCRELSGMHLTGGWFHVVGRICDGTDAWKPSGENAWLADFDDFGSGVSFGFSNRIASLPHSFEGLGVVQFHFTTRVPWVVSDSEPE